MKEQNIKKIKYLMYKHDMNQSEFSKRVGIARVTISLVLNKHKNLSCKAIEKIEKKLNVDFEKLEVM